jgi:glycosyltransferase involved in cell wall biosynthesis
MAENQTPPSVIRPAFFSLQMHFAWLFRRDVREKLLGENPTPEEAEKEFVMWWLLFGRKEYPEYHGHTAAQAAIAKEVVIDGEGFKVTRIMRHLVRIREDVWKSGAADGKVDWVALVRWYFAFGVPEHDLFGFLDADDLEYVSAPVSGIAQDATLPLSRLMLWIWQSRQDLRAAFPLTDTESRERFLAWFHIFGFRENKLFGYLSMPQAVQLCQPAPIFDRNMEPPVTRIMWYFWLADPANRADLDLRHPDGRRALSKSVDAALRGTAEFRPLWEMLHSKKPPSPAFEEEAEAEPPSPTARAAAAKRRLAAVQGRPLGVNLVGYAMGELGIGEDVRMMARALEAAGVEFCILNRQPGPEIRAMDFSAAKYLSSEARYPVTIVCMTAFDTASLWLDRPDVFRSSYVIGFWPWELPRWPEEWRGVYELVDEIWSSSRYTSEAFAHASSVPVIPMPMAVVGDDFLARSRAEFGLPEDRYLFLYVFDFMSYPARKNPYACIEAFRRAFPRGDEPVNLILKVSNIVHDSPKWSQIRVACAADARIGVLDRNLDKGTLLGLMNACDAYVSLHRAEGFGRTLAEAMLLEKPVIATGYSGNADFLLESTGYPVDYELVEIRAGEYPCGEGQMWADPDVGDAAAKLREVFLNRESAQRKAREGRKLMLKEHSPEAVGRRVLERLGDLAGAKPKCSPTTRRAGKAKSPKIGG